MVSNKPISVHSEAETQYKETERKGRS